MRLRHCLWTLLLVAACGDDGSSYEDDYGYGENGGASTGDNAASTAGLPAGTTGMVAANSTGLPATTTGVATTGTTGFDGTAGTTGGDSGSGTTGAAASGTTAGGAGSSSVDPEYEATDADCDYLFEVRAHGGQTPGDTSPFTAPDGRDHYEMFYFVPPWTEEVHTLRVDSIEDNKAILHHWLLYQEPGNGGGDGTHGGNIGLHFGNSELLTGWAPGNNGLKLHSDVGIKTIRGPGSRFAIEIHYNTTGLELDRSDRSGARVCATRSLRPKVAAVHWLGTQAIAGSTASGTCSPAAEAHILSYSPHMHVKGKHMRSIIRRADGSTETLTDKPFAFEDQAQYRVDTPSGEVVVGPGDTITTTCEFTGPSVFGPGTNSEMCYNFVLAWPAGALTSPFGILGSVVGGQNTCIDLL